MPVYVGRFMGWIGASISRTRARERSAGWVKRGDDSEWPLCHAVGDVLDDVAGGVVHVGAFVAAGAADFGGAAVAVGDAQLGDAGEGWAPLRLGDAEAEVG